MKTAYPIIIILLLSACSPTKVIEIPDDYVALNIPIGSDCGQYGNGSIHEIQKDGRQKSRSYTAIKNCIYHKEYIHSQAHAMAST